VAIVTPEQRRLYAAAIVTGRRFGIGRPPWIYAPPASGDGVSALPSYHSDGSRPIYIVRERTPANAQAAPGAAIGQDHWRLIGEAGADLAGSGVLTDGSRAFLIVSIDNDQGYPSGIVEPTGLPDLAASPRTTEGEEEELMQIVQGTTPTLLLLLVSSADDKTAVTGATVTAQISKNGGAFAATTNSPTEVGRGFYKVVLTAAETETLGQMAIVASATGCNEFRDRYKVVSL
jgi:hypothetical protein